MPEAGAWAGKSHDAATAMFSRATERASKFTSYAEGVGSAFKGGANTIGGARYRLLQAVDDIDAGELQVNDAWVVLIKPVRMSEEKIAELKVQAAKDQTEINRLLLAVGDADDQAADAMQAAAQRYGFELPDQSQSWLNLGDLPPGDQVPNPRTPDGLEEQSLIRATDQMTNIREVSDSLNSYGDLVTTVAMQDGSKKVITQHNPFGDKSKSEFRTCTEYDKSGHMLASTSSWHELSDGSHRTEISYPDGSVWAVSMDHSGYLTSGFITPDGRRVAVPVEIVDKWSSYAGAGLTGLQRHIGRGGSLPMVSAESVTKIGGATKFGSPALAAATAVYDVAMANNLHDRCAAAVGGIVGAGSAFGGEKLGAALGSAAGPFAPIAVPVLAAAAGYAGGSYGTDFGKFIGDIICPY
ncbi:hypothetical protein [Mycolicibacter acidiphilus]|nr:hypothetical protein [Mycolicibacter acidiphilus]